MWSPHSFGNCDKFACTSGGDSNYNARCTRTCTGWTAVISTGLWLNENVPRGIPRARVLGPARTAVRSDTAALRLRTRRLSDGPRAHNAWVGRKAAGRAAPLDYMLHYESARHLPCMPVSSRHPYCCMPVSSASILLRICLPLLVKGLLACAHSLQVRSLQRLEPHQVGLLVELLAPIRHA